MLTTFIVLGITILIFISGKYREDMVALSAMLVLYILGIIDGQDALSGFSNNTVVMIAALFVIGEGMSRTGVTAWIGNKMVEMSKNRSGRFMVVLLVGTAVISAFVSNTGTVASLMPAAMAAAWRLRIPASKMLIPMAFAANTGGLLTLTGTPPNIIVSEELIDNGFRGFEFFEFSLIGIPLLIAFVIYMYYLGDKLLPANRSANVVESLDESLQDMKKSFQLSEGFYNIRFRGNSTAIGKTLKELELSERFGMTLIKLYPVEKKHQGLRERLNLGQKGQQMPDLDYVVAHNDKLLVKGNAHELRRLINIYNVSAREVEMSDDLLKERVISDEVGLCRALITPGSVLKGYKVNLGRFNEKYRVQLLGIRRNNKTLKGQGIVLKEGDTLLIRGPWDSIRSLQEERRNFAILGHPEALAKEVGQINTRGVIAIAALVFMVILLVTGVVSSSIAVILAALMMVTGGCITMPQAYQSINWNIVMIIATMIPLSIAMQKTGAADLIATGVIDAVGGSHPIYLLVGVFFITSLLSQVINNSAAAILMTPIILSAVLPLGFSPEPFMMMLAVAASTTFLTPFGTTTNLMVLNAGKYAFTDYTKVGFGLIIIFLAISLLLIPLIWPFQ